MNSFCYLITASEKSDVSLHNAFKICLINPPTFQKAANPVAFSAGTWYNNSNKNPGKIAETSRGEKRETQTLADWRRGF